MIRPSLDAIRLDVRNALRAIKKNRGFSATVIVTLALGIGVNAAALAVAYGILFRPLPYADPSRVVILNLLFADGGDLGFSPGALQDWLPRLRTVETAAGYYRREVTIRSGGRSAVMPAAFVTDGFFEVLGTPAEFGHARIDTAELMLSQRLMNRILSGDPAQSVGVPATVSEITRTIGGVMPADFAFPDAEIGVWLRSSVLIPGTRPESSGYSKIVARLKPGVTLDQIRDDAYRVRLELNPQSREQVSVVVLGESVVGGMRGLLAVAVAGAVLVLVVACANVATLFIGRDIARARERAARIALGATGFQLVRGVLIEFLVIASIAALVGVGLGGAALAIFLRQASGSISGIHRVSMDLPVAAAIAGLTIAVTLLCAGVPAWHAARADFSPFVRAPTSSTRRAWRVRGALVVAQIACSCILLIGAGLLARTVSVLMRENPGFQPDGAIEAKVVLSDTVLFDGASTDQFVRGWLDRVRAMPGVQYAGVGTNLPPRPPMITIAIRVVDGNRDETRLMKVGSATPGYLRALGAQFIAGRDFDDGDAGSRAPVVILSESVARFYFQSVDPVGRTMARLPRLIGGADAPVVIGVVRDMKYEGLDAPAGSAIYVPWALRPLGSAYLIVRAAGDPMRLAPDIRAAARALDPSVPIPEVQSLQDVMAQSIANRRLRALPAIGFGLLAVGVALVGVLATLSTLVAERRRDLAIRSALGASPGRLVWTIVSQGLALTALGLIAGVGLASTAAHALASLLYRVSPYDAMTFGGAVFLVGAGAVLTTYLAAWRVRAVDPLVVLKHG